MNQPVPPKRPNDKGKTDSRLESFLHRAAPIIAAERGLTDAARIKIESLANDMKLPRELFAQGMEMLQGEPPVANRKKDRWEKAFEKSMRAKVKKIPRGIMTSAIETKAVQIGQEKYQLTELQAREILREILADLKIQRVSVSQAEQHVETMVRELIGDSTYVPPEARERLADSGKQWGVSKEHVNSLVELYVENNLQSQQRQRQFMTTIIGIGVFLIIAFLGGLIYFTTGNGAADDDSGEIVDKGDKGLPSKIDEKRAAFWDENTALAVVKNQLKTPGITPAIPLMADADPETRKQGYAKVWPALAKQKFDNAHRQRVGDLAKGILRTEESDEAANTFVDEMFNLVDIQKRIPKSGKELLTRGRFIFRVASQVLVDKKLSVGRKQYLAEKLSDLTNVDFDDKASDKLLNKRYTAGYFQTLLTKLSSVVSDKPSESITLFTSLGGVFVSGISEAKRNELELNFILSAIPNAGSQWTQLKPLIQKTIDSAAPERLAQIILLYESTDNAEAQRFIGDELLSMVGLIPEDTSPRAIASALRKRLGIDEPPPVFDLAAAKLDLKERFRRFIRDTDISGATEADAAELIAKAAYYATTAQEFYRKPDSVDLGEKFDSNMPDFSEKSDDEEGDDESEDDDVDVLSDGRDDEVPKVSDETFQRFLRPVTKHKPYKIGARVNALRSLSVIAKMFEDITDDQARGFSIYLFANKNEPEHEELLEAVSNFGHWPRLLIAVSDNLRNSEVDVAWQKAIVEQLLGDELSPIINRDSFRREAQRELFNKAIVLLEHNQLESSSANASREFELLEDYLKESYRKRCSLSRAKAVPSNSKMADLCRIWLVKLSDGSPSAEETMRELKSAQLLSQNDLEATVAIQRILISDIARSLKQKNPTATDAIDLIVDSSANRHKSADSILFQLFNNERTLFELWLEGVDK